MENARQDVGQMKVVLKIKYVFTESVKLDADTIINVNLMSFVSMKL
jgi:hypothetical protein